MLKAISDYAKAADLGIQDMQFEFDSKELKDDTALPSNLPVGIKAALVQFMHALSENSVAGEARLKMGAVSAKASHQGENRDGKTASYLLELSDESDGTRKLMALAPAIESALQTGGILLVDELERELHPMLMNYIIAKFQSSTSNPHGAQIVFTTHNTELMNLELLRKDQLYFADKRDKDGSPNYIASVNFPHGRPKIFVKVIWLENMVLRQTLKSRRWSDVPLNKARKAVYCCFL